METVTLIKTDAESFIRLLEFCDKHGITMNTAPSPQEIDDVMWERSDN